MILINDGGNDEQRPMTLAMVADRLASSNRPIVRIVVEGKVGSGKTAILALIKQMLEGKAETYVEDEYTQSELNLEECTDHCSTLAMYSPIVLLCEQLNPNIL